MPRVFSRAVRASRVTREDAMDAGLFAAFGYVFDDYMDTHATTPVDPPMVVKYMTPLPVVVARGAAV